MIVKLPHYKGCFGCGHLNPIGLRLERYWDKTSGTVFSEFVLPRQYEGFEGIIHGGIVSTIADELIWWVIAAQKRVCTVTAELKVRYKRPVYSDRPYRGEAWIVKDKGRIIQASCRIVDEGKDVCAEAEGVFVALSERDWQKFLSDLEDPSVFEES